MPNINILICSMLRALISLESLFYTQIHCRVKSIVVWIITVTSTYNLQGYTKLTEVL
jgi:hypothetical protein